MAGKKKIEGLLIHASVGIQVPDPNSGGYCYNLIPGDFNFCDAKITAEFPNNSKIIITIEKKPKGIGGRGYWYQQEKKSQE